MRRMSSSYFGASDLGTIQRRHHGSPLPSKVKLQLSGPTPRRRIALFLRERRLARLLLGSLSRSDGSQKTPHLVAQTIRISSQGLSRR